MRAGSRVHLDYLDGVRGWAATFVVLHHMWQFVVVGPDFRPLPRWFVFLTPLRFGAYAVAVFIVLSGYCLMLPIARSPSRTPPGGLRPFLLRRGRRILPPYLAALCLSAALIALGPLARRTGTQWDICLPALTSQNLLAHLALVHNLFEHLQWKLNAPMWTVALEWQIYFVFALVLLPLWRRAGAPAMCVSAFAVGLLPLCFGLGYLGTWFLGCFALGMCAALANFSANQQVHHAIEARLVDRATTAGAVAVGVIMVAHHFIDVPDAVSDTLVACTTAAYFVTATHRFQERGPTTRLMRFFADRNSTRLGSFSYSIYLVHYPLVAALYLVLRPLGLSPPGNFALLVSVGMPSILLVAYGFHCLFERPFMRLERRA